MHRNDVEWKKYASIPALLRETNGNAKISNHFAGFDEITQRNQSFCVKIMCSFGEIGEITGKC